MPHSRLSRRSFLRHTAALGAAGLVGGLPSLRGEADAKSGPDFCLFTKHLLGMEPAALAEHVASLGFAGIEAPVRAGGHVLPERVEDDLPGFVETLKKSGVEIRILTSGINAVSPAQHTEKVLRAASRLGIKRFRMNWWRYDLKKPLPPQLEEMGARVKDLIALSRELGLQALYQNHNGPDYVGATIWDVESLMRAHRPEDWGFAYDIMHATVVGGTSWPTPYHLARPRIGAALFKDFQWGEGLSPKTCPLGAGVGAGPEFAKLLKGSGFRGPVVLHVEHLKAERITNAEEARTAREATVADFATLKRWWEYGG